MSHAAEDFPRVLIVGSEPLNEFVGAGVTLAGLFGAWPRGSIADVYEGAAEPNLESGAWFYSLRIRPPIPRNRVMRQVALALRVLRGSADQTIFFGRPSPSLHRFVRDFRPDVIFCEVASLASAETTLALARKHRVPIVVHVADDWMPRWPMNVIGRRLYKVPARVLNWRMGQRMRQLVAESRVRLAISRSLADALEVRYGVPFGVAYNCVDPAAWPRTPAPERAPGEPVRLLYSGSIFRYGQSESLAAIADVVRELHAEGVPIHLTIASQHADDPAIQARCEGPGVTLAPLAPRGEFQARLLASDVLLLPTNFDQNTIQFLRYSMPGKMAEYLMAGRAVLAYGPPEVEQVRYLRERGVGVVVDHASVDDLREAVRRLATDAAWRTDLGRRAREMGEADFSLPVMQATILDLIRGLVRGES